MTFEGYGDFQPGVLVFIGGCTFTRKADQHHEGFRLEGPIVVVFDHRVKLEAEAPRTLKTVAEAVRWADGFWQGFHAGKAANQ